MAKGIDQQPKPESVDVPVTPENMLEHPKTPPAMLHSWVKKIDFKNIGDRASIKRAGTDGESGTFEDLRDAVKHPNISTDSLGHVYQSVKPQVMPLSNKIALDDEHEQLLSHALEHPNFPAAAAEDLISILHGRKHVKDWQDTSSLIEQAAKHPGVNRELLKELTAKQIQDDSVEPSDGNFSSSHVRNLEPEWLLGLHGRGDRWQPESEQMTDEQKKNNRRLSKIFLTMADGLRNTNLHTPENTAQVLNMLHDRAPDGFDSVVNKYDFLKDYVKSNPHVTGDQLEKLFTTTKPEDEYGSDHHELRKELINHPSADPGFLARVAFAPKTDAMVRNTGDSGNFSDLQAAAVSHPRFPEESKKKLIASIASKKGKEAVHSDVLDALMEAPVTTADDIRTLHGAGIRSALMSSKAPQDLIEKDFMSGRDTNLKSHDAAREYLRMPNLPPTVLSQLVNHKNMNVAKEALEHGNVDKGVVEAALKRKAREVNEAALKHPLAGHEHLIESLKQGKASAHDLIFGRKEPSRRDRWKGEKAPELEVNPEAAAAIAGRYDGFDKKTIESTEGKAQDSFGKFLKIKHYLATQPGIPESIRSKSAKDIADKFLKASSEGSEEQDLSESLGNSVTRLADLGNKDAREAALKRPGHLNTLALDNSDKYDSGYLERAASKIDPSQDDFVSIAQKILHNPNTSDQVFENLLMRPEMMDDPSNYHAGRRWGGGGDNLIDARMKGKPDAYVSDFFDKLLGDDRPESYDAVVRSHSAPVDHWDEAWSRLPVDRKTSVIDDGHIPRLLSDEQQKRKAFTGAYDFAVDGLDENKSNYVRKMHGEALKSLQADEESDRNLVHDFLSHQSTLKEDDAKRVTGIDFTEKLSDSFWEKEHVPEMTERLMTHADERSALEFGVPYVVRATDEMRRDGSGGDSGVSAAQYLAQSASKGIDRLPPDQQQDALAKRWSKILDHEDVAKLRSARNSKTLDFLANLPGSPESSAQVKNKALQLGLLSDDAAQNLTVDDPVEFNSIMSNRSTSRMDKAALMQATLSAGGVHPEILRSISLNVDHSALLPASEYRHGRDNRTRLDESTKKTQMDHAHMVVGRFMDHALKAEDGPELIARFIDTMASRETRPQSGGLYAAEEAELVGGMTDRLEREAQSGSLAASRSLYSVVERLSDSKSRIMFNPKAQSRVTMAAVDSAIAMNDFDTLTKMSAKDWSDKRIGKHIAKAMQNPEALTDDSLMNLQSISQRSKFDLKTFRGIIDESLRRAEGNANLMGATVATLGESFKHYMTLKDKDGSVKDHMDTAKRNQFSIDTLLRYQDHPVAGPNAKTYLCQQISEGCKVEPGQSKQIFMSLGQPHEADIEDGLRNSLANDPDVIAASTTGWRLQAMARSIARLNPDTATVVTGRMLSDPQVTPEQKGWYAGRLILKNDMKREDVAAIARSLGPEAILDTMKEAKDARGSYKVDQTSIHHLADNAISSLDDVLSGRFGIKPGGTQFDYEHSDKIIQQAEKAAYVCSGYHRSSTVTDAKEKNEKIDALTDKALDCYEKVLDEVFKQGDAFGEDSKDKLLNRVIPAIQTFFSHIREDRHQAHRIYNEHQSKRILDVVTKAEKLDPPKFTPDVKSNLLSNWLTQAKVSDEDWEGIHSDHPEMFAALASASGFSTAALAAVNLDKIMSSDLPREVNVGELIGSAMQKASPYGRAKVYPDMYRKAMDRVKKTGSAVDLSHAITIAREAINAAPQAISASDLMEMEGRSGYEDPSMKMLDMSNSGIIKLAMISGAGGREYFDHLIKSFQSMPEDAPATLRADVASSLASSPHIDEASAFALIEHTKEHGGMGVDTAHAILRNPHMPSSVLAHIYHDYILEGRGPANAMRNSLLRNPNVGREEFDDAFQYAEGEEGTLVPNRRFDNPGLRNPKHGLDRFLSIAEADDKLTAGLKAQKTVKESGMINTAEYSAARNRLRGVLPLIPAEGISWVDFKRANKQLENLPEVRELFKGKMGQNDRVTPEDVQATMQRLPSNSFAVTYTDWSGAQRHLEDHNSKDPATTDPSNLVMQLNTSRELQQEMEKDPKFARFFQFIQEAAENSDHPVSPHTVGWVRIDSSSGKKGWVVEEFQSDFSARLRDDVESLVQDAGESLMNNGVHVSPEEMIQYTHKVEKILSGWYHAALHGVEELARKQGVKNLYIHGRHVRARLAGLNPEKAYPVKLMEMYHREPPKFGYEECDYTDYPAWSQSFLENVSDRHPNEPKALQCWRKKLSD